MWHKIGHIFKFVPILDQYCTILPTLDQYEFRLLKVSIYEDLGKGRARIEKFKTSSVVSGLPAGHN